MTPSARTVPASRRLATLAGALALALGALVPARAEPVAPLHLENLVPATTLAFVSFENVGTWEARFGQTSLGRMIADPEMQAFAKPLAEDVQKMLTEGGKGPLAQIPPIVGQALQQLRGLEGQASIALAGLEGDTPVLMAGLDFGAKVGDFTTFLGRVKEEMGEDLPIRTSETGGRTWWTVGDPEGPPAVSATVVGTSVLISTDRGWLDEVAASGAAAMPSSLGQSADFQGTKNAVGGADTAAFVYANVPAILGKVGLEGEGARIARALGADAIKAAAYGMAFKGDGFLDTLVVHAPGADHGVFPLLQTRPATHAGLALAPATTFLYAESTVSVSTLLGKIRTLAASVDAEAAAELDREVAEASRALGVDIENDLLAGLADEGAWYVGVPETGGVFPEVAVMLAVKDPAKFEGTFENAVNAIAGMVSERERIRMVQRTIEYRGKRLHVVDLAKTRGDDVVPFTPTWAVLEGRLVVTLVPHAMKEFVLRTSQPGTGGLASQEDVRALLAAAPQGHGALLYVDLQAALNLLYDTGVPVLQTAVKPNLLGNVPLRLDWAMLPPARTMRPYFRSMGAFVTCDDQGLRASIHGPIPAVPVLAALGAAAALFTMRRHGGDPFGDGPVPGPVVEFAQVDEVLQGLAERVREYRAQQGALPERLDDLVTKARLLEALPRDPWGGEVRYRVAQAQQGLFELSSAGPDREFGTEDDVSDTFQAR